MICWCFVNSADNGAVNIDASSWATARKVSPIKNCTYVERAAAFESSRQYLAESFLRVALMFVIYLLAASQMSCSAIKGFYSFLTRRDLFHTSYTKAGLCRIYAALL